MSAGRIMTAVVTGRHPYDVPAFQAVFRSMPEIDAYPQHLEEFAGSGEALRKKYDAIVFYNFHQETPGNEQDWWNKGTREALEQLGSTKQGILVLHHAILAFPQWPLWSEICGIEDRRFGYHDDQTVRIEVANPNHPITLGLKSWEMIDETYTMNSASDGSEILLTTDHPKSMKVIGWTRQYKNARVFCFESGHDNQAFANPSFRAVVQHGIQWVAGRI